MEDLAAQIETENPPVLYDAKGRVVPVTKSIVNPSAYKDDSFMLLYDNVNNNRRSPSHGSMRLPTIVHCTLNTYRLCANLRILMTKSFIHKNGNTHSPHIHQ
jgi:hypothetical protein